MDESDDEWEGHITWYYGAQARACPNALRRRDLDPGMDMNEMVVRSLDIVDRIREEAANDNAQPARPQRPPATGNGQPSQEIHGLAAVAQDMEVDREGDGSQPREDIANAAPLHGDSPPRTGSPFQDVDDQHGQYDAEFRREEAGPVQGNYTSEGEELSDDDSAMDWGESEDESDAAVTALEEAAATPLFAGSNHSSMGTTYVLLSGGKLNGCSDTYMDELFRTLSSMILPQPNSLPKSYREASEYLRQLGHTYKTYDVCPNNCKLFRGALKNARVCPDCRAPRKKQVGRSQVPYKVSRVFPLTPRLKRMFRSPMQAAAMTWWATVGGEDGVMKHVSDSAQWKWISSRFREEFGYDDRNVRMALVTDGFNPNSDKRGTYSIWPILLMNYNIAPWLTTKNYFIMLAVLIPGPKSITAEHFDVFIEPLIEELLNLWTYGVYCLDVAQYKQSSHFILKAMVIWTVGDFPAYGMLAGCTTNGFVGCPVCGEGFRSRRSKVLHKNIFCGCARRFLVEEDHHMRFDTVNFKEVEERVAPVPVSGSTALANGQERLRWLRDEGTPAEHDPVRRNGIKRVTSLFRLPYWKVRWQPFHSCDNLNYVMSL